VAAAAARLRHAAAVTAIRCNIFIAIAPSRYGGIGLSAVKILRELSGAIVTVP
jgi:hypothetical protein